MNDCIILQPTDMLVKRIEDYFSKTDDDKINLTLPKDQNTEVGIIYFIGEKIDPQWMDKLVYYHKGVSTFIPLKGIGDFDLVTESLRLVVRLDQDKNKY